MKNDDNIERKIEDALNSINHIQRATPKPYLLTRIHARLDEQVKSVWEIAASFISRPLVMALGLCLIIAINLSVILNSKSTKNNSAAERPINAFTDEDEYGSAFATIDNIDNP